MRRISVATALAGILALSGMAWADTDPTDPVVDSNTKDKADKQAGSAKTVKKEDVKTWTMMVDGKEWSARPATPSYDGDTGLFRLSSAYTLPKGKAAFSVFRDNYDRDPGALDFSIIGANIAYGATSRLELFTQIGIQNRLKVNNLNAIGEFNDLPFAGTAADNPTWQTGFGDIRIGAKYKFLDDYYGHDGLGLAGKVYVKLPTADDSKGLGTGKADFGVDLIASKNLSYGADLHASIGYRITGDPSGINLANAFTWGVGINAPACKRFAIQAEITGLAYGSTSLVSQTNPVDFIIGPVVWLGNGFFIRPAWGYALAYDGRGRPASFEKKSGKQIEVGYHPGTPCCEVVAPPPPAPPPVNHPPTVALDCVKKSLLAGETTPCNATASDPDGDPLTYSWSSSAGRVSGSGATTTFDSTGVPCGTSVTVTVTVSDGRGGTASANDTVKVVCPERKPEALTCTSGGFPRNLSRLNNVDKACLDDVASRLRQDPNSRVIIVGHADTQERYADVIGRKRAEAVKTYLVKDRGVDESRITVRSAGSSKPLDSGASAAARAKNRRVDVIFVPEGATAPEDDD